MKKRGWMGWRGAPNFLAALFDIAHMSLTLNRSRDIVTLYAMEGRGKNP